MERRGCGRRTERTAVFLLLAREAQVVAECSSVSERVVVGEERCRSRRDERSRGGSRAAAPFTSASRLERCLWKAIEMRADRDAVDRKCAPFSQPELENIIRGNIVLRVKQYARLAHSLRTN
ncbi:hypothetical protein BU16DRAFT_360533 [Lophium mytilinum]|uniref:Uncharacterized protein n=1 Tax=Lophium mytilinum TaxID=390894 RepID=A0A6A6QUU5_9PEZI|nr:hypothetical protein BU16DRAFT_360533 [Lophium mytilinum]